jgi:hypothetical protein
MRFWNFNEKIAISEFLPQSAWDIELFLCWYFNFEKDFSLIFQIRTGSPLICGFLVISYQNTEIFWVWTCRAVILMSPIKCYFLEVWRSFDLEDTNVFYKWINRVFIIRKSYNWKLVNLTVPILSDSKLFVSRNCFTRSPNLIASSSANSLKIIGSF